MEFSLDGKILTANRNFLQIFGYSLADLQGKPHQVLCPPAVAQSASYAAFWQKLRQGEFVAGDYQRVASDGKAVWLHASYNPVFDADDKVVKGASSAILACFVETSYRVGARFIFPARDSLSRRPFPSSGSAGSSSPPSSVQ